MDLMASIPSLNYNSFSMCILKFMPVNFVVKHPAVIFTSYVIIQFILWVELARFQLCSNDQLMSSKSENFEIAQLIEYLFGKNQNPFALHRSTRLGMWLEIIVTPKTPRLLVPEAIMEIHHMDQMLRNLTIVTNITRIGPSHKFMVNILKKDRTTKSKSFKLSDICAKQSENACSIDGSYVLEKEFLTDVEDNDLHYSKGGYYSYPRRGLPSYGKYMFGKTIVISDYMMIQDVNALRFRYNLEGDFNDQQKLQKQMAFQSTLWENTASQFLKKLQLKYITVTFATSTLMIDTFIEQVKQGLPYLAVSMSGFTISLIFALSKLTSSPKKYLMCLIAVILNCMTAPTILSILTLFHYKPTGTSLLNVIIIIAFGIIYFAIMVSKFEEISQYQYLSDNKVLSTTAFQSAFRQIAHCFLLISCFAIIVGTTTSLKDVQSSAVIIALGGIWITTNSLFAYLPICIFGYRINAMKFNRYRKQHTTSSNRMQECCQNLSIVSKITNHFNSKAKKTHCSDRIANAILFNLYTGIFTIVFMLVLFFSCLLCARSNIIKCRKEAASYTAPNRLKDIDKCSLQTRDVFRQSDLVLPSLKTRIGVKKKYKTTKEYSLPIQNLYAYLNKTEMEFAAGAPIQIVYISHNASVDTCPTLNISNLLLNVCKKMPATDSKFSIAWYSIFKSNVERNEIVNSLFKKDVVFSNPAKKNGKQKAEACSYIKHYRVYCSFEEMQLNLQSVQTMQEFKRIVDNISVSRISKSTGVFKTFSLAYFILELVHYIYSSMFISALTIFFLAILSCLIHQLINIKVFKCLRNQKGTYHIDNGFTRNWNVPKSIFLYVLSALETLLFAYAYFCLFDLKITFLNSGIVFIGFLLIPTCINDILLVKQIEMLNPKQKEIISNEQLEQRIELVYDSHRLTNNQGVSMRTSIMDDDLAFIYYTVYPLLGCIIPLFWFFIMIPLTESPLIRTVQHISLFVWGRSIFDCIFMYPSLDRVFTKK